jgi:hypothetical protein
VEARRTCGGTETGGSPRLAAVVSVEQRLAPTSAGGNTGLSRSRSLCSGMGSEATGLSLPIRAPRCGDEAAPAPAETDTGPEGRREGEGCGMPAKDVSDPEPDPEPRACRRPAELSGEHDRCIASMLLLRLPSAPGMAAAAVEAGCRRVGLRLLRACSFAARSSSVVDWARSRRCLLWLPLLLRLSTSMQLLAAAARAEAHLMGLLRCCSQQPECPLPRGVRPSLGMSCEGEHAAIAPDRSLMARVASIMRARRFMSAHQVAKA